MITPHLKTQIFLLLFFASHLALASTPSLPDVVFIIMDDMNGYGVLNQYPVVQMPYVEKFKRESVNFTLAACASPVCTPSRASFMSGLYPHETGAYLNGCDPWRGGSILTNTEAIPECFKRIGCETFGRGKIFHAQLAEGRQEAMFGNRPIYQGGFGPFAEEDFWSGGGRFNSIKPWTGPDSDFPDVMNADAAIEFLRAEV